MSLTKVQQDFERVLPLSSLDSCRHIVRRLRELKPVLYDSASCGDFDAELPVYEVHRDSCNEAERGILLKQGLRYDVTIMPALTLGQEYVKTRGHRHLSREGGWSHPEIFEVLEGEAHFLMQRYRGEELVDVSLVVAQQGDVVLVPPECGHVMVNPSSSRVVVANLVSRDCLETSKPFTDRKGGAYFILKGGRFVKNANYLSLPELRIAKADGFGPAKYSGLLRCSVRRPGLFDFLSNSRELPQTSQWGDWGGTGAIEEAWKPDVTVVIPTLNEGKCIGSILREIPGHTRNLCAMLVVDASDDKTQEIAASLGARVLEQEGQGKGKALRQAFDAIDSDIIIMMDGDGSMKPQEIPDFVRTIRSGADIVKGSRFLRGGGSEDLTAVRKLGNSFFLLLVNLLWSTKYTDLCYGYFAFTRRALDRLKPHLVSAKFQIEAEICVKAKTLGLKVLEIPSVELRRLHGTSKVSGVHDSLRILNTIIAERLSRSSNNC